jgi:hypothetical protein
MVVDVTQPKGRKGDAQQYRKRLMTQAELQEWLSTAVESDETSGRCKVESRFTFKQ